jgi:hypothetical protein
MGYMRVSRADGYQTLDLQRDALLVARRGASLTFGGLAMARHVMLIPDPR